MNLFHITDRQGRTVILRRDEITNQVNFDSRVVFCKMLMDAFVCNLQPAHRAMSSFVDTLNKLEPSEASIRRQIEDEIKTISNTKELLNILCFMRNCVDHSKTMLGSFDNNGDYIPNDPFV